MNYEVFLTLSRECSVNVNSCFKLQCSAVLTVVRGVKSFLVTHSARQRSFVSFLWDYCVTFLLGCSMGGQQPGMPHSPRDPEDYSMDVDGPSDNPGYVSLFIEVCNHVTLIWVACVEWL